MLARRGIREDLLGASDALRVLARRLASCFFDLGDVVWAAWRRTGWRLSH
jgi:hypothetical protein